MRSPLLLAIAAVCLGAGRPADETLRDRVDREIEAAHVGPVAPPAADDEFLRRVSLDLAGLIPAAQEARAFLDDPAPDKRSRLIDRLLAGRDHVRHMAATFDAWLMERRVDKHVKADAWRAYLIEAFEQNKPYDQLAREILSADGLDAKLRPAAKFVLEREVDPYALTRDTGRMFLGVDLQCAQCHDHPRIGDYEQRDYHGLYAFFSRSYLFQPDPKQPGMVADKAEGEVAYKSVFTKKEGATRPRLAGGEEIAEPTFVKGQEYQVAPDPKNKTLRPVPKHSRRAQLAARMTDPANRAFARNIVNRLWAHMMGRGLVEPVDLHHSGNPPTHPALLNLLADAFVAMKYDVRAFLRELAFTRAYQRNIEIPAAAAAQARTAATRLPELESESLRLKNASAKAEEALKKAEADLEAAVKTAAEEAAGLAKAEAALAEIRKALETSRKDLTTRRELLTALTEATAAAGKIVDLAPAAAVFKAKADRLSGEMDAATKQTEQREATEREAEKAADPVRARAAEAREKADALERDVTRAEERHRAERVAAGHAARRVAEAQALVEYGGQYAAAVASREAARKVETEFRIAHDVVDGHPRREAELAAARQALEAAARAAEESLRKLAEKEGTIRVLAEAAAKAETVRQKAAGDAELTAAAAQVKALSDTEAAGRDALKRTGARLDEELAKSKARAAAAEEAVRRGAADLEASRKKVGELEPLLKPAKEKAEADDARRDEALEKLGAEWSNSFAIGALTPLTPEQLAWSMMQATGQVDLARAAGEAAFDKLKANVEPFVKLFGGGAGQPQGDFHATADQALFLRNGALVRGWLQPGQGGLTDRLLKRDDPKALAEDLYLSVFTRRPSEAEVTDVAKYLGARKDKRADAVQEMAWALLSSAEFRFKH